MAQAIGAAGTGANTIYPAINIGALDDQIQSGGTGGSNSGGRPTDYKEKIVNYSDRGSGIDCYAQQMIPFQLMEEVVL